LTGPSREILATYWQQTINHLETDTHDFKIHQLPLARIKKVMKADPEVKMISAEAPILFAKGCDIFITELTMRAWIHAEDNKRRTLQRSDIAAALAKSDMFDFLIDIVPREDSAGHGSSSKRPNTSGQAAAPQVQQQPPQQQMPPPDYGMQHGAMGPPESQYGRAQMYPAHMGGDAQSDPSQGYGQPPQIFGGEMYNPYGPGQFGGTGAQQVSAIFAPTCYTRACLRSSD
jgi:nuclear transcription factor Y, gamma